MWHQNVLPYNAMKRHQAKHTSLADTTFNVIIALKDRKKVNLKKLIDRRLVSSVGRAPV